VTTGELYKSILKLTFFKGASLKDPANLFNSSLDGNVEWSEDVFEQIAQQTAAGDHSGVDIIAKRAVEYAPPNENSDTRLSAITTGKRTVRSPRLGPMSLGPGFATGE
jgi:hypothetical protein